MKKRIMILIMILACATMIIPTSVADAKSNIHMSKKKVTIRKGKNHKLTVRGTSKRVKWKSSNRKVATVSSKGRVYGKKKGTAYIRAKVAGKTLKCKVTVKNKKKSSQSSKKSQTVYWTSNGTVYHCTKNCPTLSRSKGIRKGSKSSCPKHRACKVCY